MIPMIIILSVKLHNTKLTYKNNFKIMDLEEAWIDFCNKR